ncbi:MAG TPA: TIGR03790 family protein [Verrucomicrobiota bacterium]|nr:TIGR03790 family protein [Verrucomicrobiota bacterium]
MIRYFGRTHKAAVILLLLTATHFLRAGDSGAEVVVVYNSRLAESRAVAAYYAQKRQVPTNQVFGFDLPTSEDMSRVDFRENLQKPLARALSTNKLWRIASQIVPATNNQPGRVEWKVVESKIRYAALCYGVPLRINSDPNLKEPGTENLRPEMRRNEACVENELALLPLIEQDVPLAGPLRNPVYTATNPAVLHPTNGVLLVSRLDGPSEAVARGLVDKALEAETFGLWGRAYFDLRKPTEEGMKAGEEWISNAAEICRRLGFETVVEETPSVFQPGFPMSQIAFYMGWYTENVAGPLAQPVVEFNPGAFAYHLHSYSAASLRATNRHWVGPFLDKGVTITMGSVTEPYLAGTPDLAVFAARLIFNGFSFGEAAYACQSVLSWQTTVVGDPLYRPFGKSPEQLHDELQLQNSPWLEWSFLRLLNLNLVNSKPVGDCIALLEQLDLTRKSAVLSEKLADLYQTQGKPSSAVHTLSQALKLKPSPQQAIRLRLKLGEGLAALNRPAEAYEVYREFLQSEPAYPDKAAIYRKLIPLAQALDKKEEAEKYELELIRLTAPARQ